MALAALWVLCFATSVYKAVRPSSFPSVFVHGAATADDYPVVTSFRTYLTGPESELRVGDRLMRVGAADLRGANALEFFASFVEQIGGDSAVAMEYERDGVRASTSVAGGSTRMVLAQLPGSLAFALAASVLWLHAAPSAMAAAFIAWFWVVAIYQGANFLGAAAVTYAVYIVHVVSMILLGPLGLRAFLRFPAGKPRERHGPLWPWVFSVLGILHTGHFGWPVPGEIGVPAAALVFAALLVAIIVVVTHTYRHADAVGRRQMRWFYFGVYCAAMPPIVAGIVVAFVPEWEQIYLWSLAAVGCLPVSLLISIVRFNFFDVDRLISTAASYNLILAAALAVGATVVPMTAEAGAELLGVDPWVGRLGLLVPLGLLVVAANNWVRPRIERRFFVERYALDVGVRQLLVDLGECGDSEALTRRLGEALFRLLRPQSCAIYGSAAQGFAPVFVAGDTVPMSIEAEGPLLVTLRKRREPLAFDEFGSGDEVSLTPFERAVLETLDAAVVVPIRRDAVLTMLLCLGPKRSGDVYTPTDLRLLATAVDRFELQMERFAQAEVVAQSKHLQDVLRRYVPGAVAEALGAGRELEPEEREITVLFVDLRGYTAFCETRAPQEIFMIVARYTESVSAILTRFGGTLVEFNGDGMMAMFGAPNALANKEAAAVAAAHEISVTVAELPPAVPDAPPLSVGVGIATGVAFVGNLHSTDRVIWTAVGNTVNLAARLQALTRELDALIAMDRRTYAMAGRAAVAGFRCCENTRIRGRGAREDVFVLPLRG